MYSKQLGRRNLSEEMRNTLIGKQYEARKKSKGAADGFRGNQYTKEVKYENHTLAKVDTATQIAEEHGISRDTVIQNAKFAKGIDIIQAQAPAVANQILHGGSGVTKQNVAKRVETMLL